MNTIESKVETAGSHSRPADAFKPTPSNVTELGTPSVLFRQFCEERKLDAQDVEAMGLELVNRGEARQLLGFTPPNDCALLPYPGADYFRLRMLGKVPETWGKYLAPRGSGCSPIYLPKWGNLDWGEIKADPNYGLIITEGEFKAYWGCKTGGKVVGLGGVEMQTPLMEKEWDWKGRKVSLCFDHDAGQSPGEYKPQVANALGKLATSLQGKGASVTLLHLGRAVTDPSSKVGLDDYFQAGGEWGRLLLTASPPPEWCEVLSELLMSNVLVVGTNNPHVYNLENGSRKSTDAFHKTHPEKKRFSPDGKKFEQLSAAWMDHRGRQTAEDYILDPRLNHGLAEKDGKSFINLWRGFPVYPPVDRPDVTSGWQQFMEGLFGEHWEWVGLWAAHMLNRPWERTSQAVMLITTVQGIGKSLFGEFLMRLVGPHGAEISPSRLMGQFNANEEAKVFTLTNELDNKFKHGEGELNDLITAETISIEPKGKDIIVLPNLARRYFTANASAPCRMSPKQRRILVLNPPRITADTRGEWGTWVGQIVAKWKSDESALAAIRSWFDDLWAERGGEWDPTLAVPRTQAAEDAEAAGRTTNNDITDDILEWAEGMYADHPAGFWFAATPEMKRGTPQTKVFGEVTALVKAMGGCSLDKTVTIQLNSMDAGGSRRVTIWDCSSALQRYKDMGRGRWCAGEGKDMYIDAETGEARPVPKVAGLTVDADELRARIKALNTAMVGILSRHGGR